MKGNELTAAWGDFVSEVGERKGGWNLYATLTFRERTREQMATGWTKVGAVYANKSFGKWLSVVRELGDSWRWRVASGKSDGVFWFKALENTRDRGVPHVHALVGGVEGVRRAECWSAWFEEYGFARVLPYDERLGARFYLCKYVTKELGEVEFSRNLERIRQEVCIGEI